MSRDTFYRYKAAVEEGGVEALFERTRRKPNLANRVGEATEQAVIKSALEFPAYGQARTSNELRKQGVFVSPSGVRSIWLRHDLANFKARLKALEARVAEDGIILTEAHIRGPGAGLGKEESRRRSPRRGGNGPPRLSGFTGHLLCRQPRPLSLVWRFPFLRRPLCSHCCPNKAGYRPIWAVPYLVCC